MIQSIASLILILINFSLFASSHHLPTTLHIQEKGTGKSLSKVKIQTQHGAEIFSDNDGKALIEIPESGDGIVRVSRGAYETLEIPYSDLRPQGNYDIFLIPAIKGENVIVVQGKKRKQQVSRKTISIREAEKISPSGDPGQVIKLLPGVQTQNYSSEIISRGSGPRDSLYYVDNLQVPFVFHNVGDLSIIPGSMMQDVKMDSGGFGPEYGNATGAVVVIRTKTEIPERAKTEFVFNVPYYSGVLHTQPLGEQESLTVGIRRSYIDVVLREYLRRKNKKEAQSKGELLLTPYFADAQIVYLKREERGYTKLSLLSAYSGITASFPSDSYSDTQGQANLSFKTSFVNLGLEKNTNLGSRWRLNTSPQIYHFQTNAGFFGNTFGLKVWTLRIPTEFTRKLDSNQEINLGLDPAYYIAFVNYNAILYNASDPTFDPEEPVKVKSVQSARYGTFASWVNFDQTLGPLVLSPGLRVFQNSAIKKFSADPRLRTRYSLSEDHALKSAVGQYSQGPSPQQSSQELGNPDLPFTRSYHYVLGLESQWNEDWNSEFQIYYKHASDLIRQDAASRYNAKGSFYSHGFEVFIRHNLTSRFFGWLSYTYSRTRERDSADEAYRPSEYDQTHVFHLVGNYKLSNQWNVGGRFAHHTGDTYTPLGNAVYNASLDKYQPRTSNDDWNSERLPNYNSLTVYFGYDFLFRYWKLNMRFGVESFWLQPPVLDIIYNYDYTKTSEQKGLSSIPFFELRGEL